MKTEAGILLASSVGLLAVVGLIGVKNFLKRKHKNYQEYYSDFHRHFAKKLEREHDDHHGIEYFAMQ